MFLTATNRDVYVVDRRFQIPRNLCENVGKNKIFKKRVRGTIMAMKTIQSFQDGRIQEKPAVLITE